MKKTATLIKQVNGHQRLYRVNPPLEGNTFVVVSASALLPLVGPETYIFPANRAGKITDWGQLEGSFRGDMDYEKALHNAGYSVDREDALDGN